MSIWDEDLTGPSVLPDWFVAYRSAEDDSMENDFEALKRGEITKDEHGARAVRRAERRKQWVESLLPDRRALLEALDRYDFDDGTTHWVPSGSTGSVIIEVDEVQGGNDPVRKYLRQHIRARTLLAGKKG